MIPFDGNSILPPIAPSTTGKIAADALIAANRKLFP